MSLSVWVGTERGTPRMGLKAKAVKPKPKNQPKPNKNKKQDKARTDGVYNNLREIT